MDDVMTVEQSEAHKDVAALKTKIRGLEQKVLTATEAARRRDPEHALALARAELAQAERAAQASADAQAARALEQIQAAGACELIVAGQALAGVIAALGRYHALQLELFHKAPSRDLARLPMLRNDTESSAVHLRALARALQSWITAERYAETGLPDPERIG